MNEPSPNEYHPNMKEIPEDATGLFCFKDAARACGAECMAYIDAPDGEDYRGKQWARCLLLVNEHRTGKHLTIIANVLGKIDQRIASANADARRASGQAPATRTGPTG